MRFRLLFLSLLLVAGAVTSKADPLFFSNTIVFQNNGATTIDLFSNPGTILAGPELTFRVDVTGTLPAGGVDTLVVTYTQLGRPPVSQSFQIPFGSSQPPLTFLFSFTTSGAGFLGTPATLTLDLLNSSPDFILPSGPGAGQGVNSFSYSFNVTEPVPEPATLAMLGAGLAGFWARFRRQS